MNFCIEGIGTFISCGQVQSDGNEADKLLEPAEAKTVLGFGTRPRGFLTDYFVRPPVTIHIRFPVCIEVSHIVILRKFGAQSSSAFTLEAECHTTRFNGDTNGPGNVEGPKHLIGKEYLNEDAPNRIVFHNRRYQPRPPFSLFASGSAKSGSTAEEACFNLRHPVPMACSRVTGLMVTILRTPGSSVAALGGLQVWGQPCRGCPKEAVDKLLVHWMRRTQKTDRNSSSCSNAAKNETNEDQGSASKRSRLSPSSETFVIPEEFLDPITQEIMCQPIRLPCGIAVDSSTLEKYYTEEAKWGRSPSDPFTGKPYCDKVKPIADGALKSRIDHFMTMNADNVTIRNAPRTLGSHSKSLISQIRSVATKLFPNTMPSGSNSIPTSVNVADSNPPSPGTSQSSSRVLSMEERLEAELAKVLGSGDTYLARSSATEVKTVTKCLKCESAEESGSQAFYSHPECTHIKVCRTCLLKLNKISRETCRVCGIEWQVKDLHRFYRS